MNDTVIINEEIQTLINELWSWNPIIMHNLSFKKKNPKYFCIKIITAYPNNVD